MKACPLCRELIAEDAIKCRHCHSFLVPLTTEEPKSADRSRDEAGTVYILDKGLVRFGKFVAGALAVLTVLGAYGFGLDIKESLNGLRSSQEKAEILEDKVRRIQEEIDQEEKAMQKSRDQLASEVDKARLAAQNAQREAENAINSVQEITAHAKSESEEFEVIYTEFKTKTLSIQQQASLPDIKESKSDKVRASEAVDHDAFHSKLWHVGTTLRVRFLDGESTLQERVAKAAEEWTRYANIHFQFGSSAQDAEIRVSFKRASGSWAYIGTDALAVPIDQPTANLGFVTLTTPDDQLADMVLHEFGHVLGLFHEISNPNRKFDVDMELAYKYFTSPPNYLPKEQIDVVFRKMENVAHYREFDPQSVMMYHFPKQLFVGDVVPEKTQTGLSASDKEFIHTIYPPS